MSTGRNSPLSKRILIIGLDKINKPAAEGKEINKQNSIKSNFLMAGIHFIHKSKK